MTGLTSKANKIVRFYYDGFRNMSTWGRKVWVVILIKLFIIFVILRVFFFHDFLKNKFGSDKQKSDYVREQLTNTPPKND
jgi:hypothetical protein